MSKEDGMNFSDKDRYSDESSSSPIIIAVIIALGAIVFSFMAIKRAEKQAKAESLRNLVLVCVVKSDIPKGTKINTDHIAYRSMPIKYKASSAFYWRDRAELLGLITNQRLRARDYFMDSHFQNPSDLKQKRSIEQEIQTSNLNYLIQKLTKGTPEESAQAAEILEYFGKGLQKAKPALEFNMRSLDPLISNSATKAYQTIFGQKK